MSWDNFLALRHEAGRAKWRKELFREQLPPYLGELVSVREVMERTKKSRTWVQKRRSSRLRTRILLVSGFPCLDFGVCKKWIANLGDYSEPQSWRYMRSIFLT